VVNRKGKSPREVLSLFDEIATRKEHEAQFNADDVSIFDVIADQGKNTDKEVADEPKHDYSCSQPKSKQQQNPVKQDQKATYWSVAGFEQSKRNEAERPAKNLNSPAYYPQTTILEKNEPSQSVNARGKWKKVMRMFVLFLLVTFIFVLIQIILGPPIRDRLDDRFVIEGIIFSQDNPSAIVNGQIVSEGDVVSVVKVKQINEDSIEFQESNPISKETRRFTKNITNEIK